MIAIRDLEIFVRTAETGSLSAAARLLDMTPAATSASVKRLERHLGVQLFIRSTRKQRLSLEGARYLKHCQQALKLLDDGQTAVSEEQGNVRGTLQVSMPSDLGRRLLIPWIDDFMGQHPALELRIQLSDRVADVYEQPVDVALRYGVPPDSSMLALPLVPDNRRMLCASPAYLERHGAPRAPSDLGSHNCLFFMRNGQVHDRWRFYRDGEEEIVQVSGNRSVDDGEIARFWAVAGHGIAYKSCLDVQQDLAKGRLKALCTAWAGEPTPLNFICANRQQLNPAVRRLRDFLLERFREVRQG